MSAWKDTTENIGSNDNKWYRNNWIIAAVSVVMTAVLVLCVILGSHWEGVERTLFGNKNYYLKMEWDNIREIGNMFSSVPSDRIGRGYINGELVFNSDGTDNGDLSGENGLSTTGGIINAFLKNTRLDISYNNDFNEDLSCMEIAFQKKDEGNINDTDKSKDNFALSELFFGSKGIFIKFPESGVATDAYNISNTVKSSNYTEILWKLGDILQKVNEMIPDECVYHYDEADFNGDTYQKIEFVLNSDIQGNIKNVLLSETETLHNDGALPGGAYETIKNILNGFDTRRGDIYYGIYYTNDGMVEARELMVPDNTIQLFTRHGNGSVKINFYDDKAGVYAENNMSVGKDGIKGKLVADSGVNEMVLKYDISGMLGGFWPQGTVDCMYGLTGVDDDEGSSIPTWRAVYECTYGTGNEEEYSESHTPEAGVIHDDVLKAGLVVSNRNRTMFSMNGSFDLEADQSSVVSEKEEEKDDIAGGAKDVEDLPWKELLAESLLRFSVASDGNL